MYLLSKNYFLTFSSEMILSRIFHSQLMPKKNIFSRNAYSSLYFSKKWVTEIKSLIRPNRQYVRMEIREKKCVCKRCWLSGIKVNAKMQFLLILSWWIFWEVLLCRKTGYFHSCRSTTYVVLTKEQSLRHRHAGGLCLNDVTCINI